MDNKGILPALYITLGVVTFWFIFCMLMFLNIDNISTLGPYGDTFGILNTLFSGLAFSALIYTIFLQHEELKLQREEIKLTRIELSKTAEAQIESQKALNKANENHLKTFELQQLNSRKDNNLSLLDINYSRLKKEYDQIQYRYKEAGKDRVFLGRRSLINYVRYYNNYKLSKEKFASGICIIDYKHFLIDIYNLTYLAFYKYELHEDDREMFIRNVYNFFLHKMQTNNENIIDFINPPETNRQEKIIKAVERINVLMKKIEKTLITTK